MPVTIASCIYRNGNEILELKPSDIDISTYNTKYKGHLYCVTDNCNAKLVFVHNTSKPNYFRTWKHNDHMDNCLYKFDRVAGRVGYNTEHTLNVEISAERKLRALKEAYRISKMSEEEINFMKTKRKERRNNPTTVRRDPRVSVNPVLNSDVKEDELRAEGRRAPNLLKRTVDALSDSDIGKARILIGEVVEVHSSLDAVTIKIQHNNKVIEAKFQEAFFASSPTYVGLFHYIDKYISKYGLATFTGAGDVRLTNDGNYEFIVFHGDDFTVENMSLLSLAAHFAHLSL